MQPRKWFPLKARIIHLNRSAFHIRLMLWLLINIFWNIYEIYIKSNMVFIKLRMDEWKPAGCNPPKQLKNIPCLGKYIQQVIVSISETCFRRRQPCLYSSPGPRGSSAEGISGSLTLHANEHHSDSLPWFTLQFTAPSRQVQSSKGFKWELRNSHKPFTCRICGILASCFMRQGQGFTLIFQLMSRLLTLSQAGVRCPKYTKCPLCLTVQPVLPNPDPAWSPAPI